MNNRTPAIELAEFLMKLSKELIFEGNTTKKIDTIIGKMLKVFKAESAPKKYYNYDMNACLSTNNIICHGYGNNNPIIKGDVIKVDISLVYLNTISDICRTFICNDLTNKAYHMIEKNEYILNNIEKVLNPIISKEKKLTNKMIGEYFNKCQLSPYQMFTHYGGHIIDINHIHHEFIPNNWVKGDIEYIIKDNLTMCIEPMLLDSIKNQENIYHNDKSEVIDLSSKNTTHFEGMFLYKNYKLIRLDNKFIR